ncbi:Transketolase, thiamine diphosphate binding domain-containing protein [Mucidula mucida]|nr:Transketolase, thiamine diphosphate binding domain-containing protein [Mucidula mucida]
MPATINRSINDSPEKLVINTIRLQGGHPGTVMGAAAIGVALWRFAMRYNPKNPEWFNRDRFVLSAGHACLFQYIHLHVTGYEAWTLEQLRTYHNPNFGIAAGHPEIEFPGIEVTTGPLGQGIANAVGLAIASKNLAATYNKPGLDISTTRYEGVGQEALSIAGHLRLGNLIVVYDDNQMAANGFHVIDVLDGTNDVASCIIAALDAAKAVTGKPVFVHIRTVIGFGSRRANTGAAHGQPLGVEEVEYVKGIFGMDAKAKCQIPEEVYEYFRPVIKRGQDDEAAWNALYAKYANAHPDEGMANFPAAQTKLPTADQPTRKSSGIAVAALVPKYKHFIAGSADLLESTFVSFDGQVEFQAWPETGLGDYSGRQIRYGIREFSMIGLAMGIFFMFWLYAAPAARMTALQKLRTIGIATHDSIGIGEDGPTHQPIALASFYRALPNYNFIRPADAEECMGAWEIALDSHDTPSLFALSRQPVPLLAGSDRAKVRLGAYPIFSTASRSLNLSSSPLALNQSHFDQQPFEYRDSVLGSGKALVVAVEAWSSYGWARYAHASLSMHTFGLSAPQATLYDIFGFSVDNITEKVYAWVKTKTVGGEIVLPRLGQFEELLLGYAKQHH